MDAHTEYRTVRWATSGLALVALGTAGCTGCWLFNPLASDGTEPDLSAIATVVKDVYRTQGQGRIIFLGTQESDLEDSTLVAARTVLQDDLKVNVRPEADAVYSAPDAPLFTPVLAGSGELGVSIRLGRFRLGDDGRTTVTVFWNRSCGERGDIDYLLERDEQGWLILNRDAHPDVMGCY